MHVLRHAGWVTKACGLIPSQVHQVRKAFRLPTDAPDEALLRCAYLSAVTVFSSKRMTSLAREHDWTLEDMIWWSLRFGQDHLERCQEARYRLVELTTLVKERTVPDRSQLEMLLAFQMVPPTELTSSW